MSEQAALRQQHIALGLAYSGDGLMDAGTQAARLLDAQQGDAVASAGSAALQAQIALVRAKAAQPEAAAAEGALATPLPPAGISVTQPVEDLLAEKGRLAAMLSGGFQGRLAPAALADSLKKAHFDNEMGRLEVDFDGPPSQAVLTGVFGSSSFPTGTPLVLAAGTYSVALDRNPPDYDPVSSQVSVAVDAPAFVEFTLVVSP